MIMYKRMAFAVVTLIALTISIAAQTETPAPKDPQKARPRTTTSSQDPKTTSGERLEPDDASRTPADVPAETQANRQEQMSEEDGFKPYYNNFFSSYRLGPEDIISVEVFNQDRYSRKNIIIPPNGRVSLALIPGGVFVNGKTTAECLAEVNAFWSAKVEDALEMDDRRAAEEWTRRHWRRLRACPASPAPAC